MAYNKPLSVRTNGIKCIDVNQAKARFLVTGERDQRH
jgi:hypothetical protein